MDSLIDSLFGQDKSIVLVGNSKRLIEEEHGQFIDSHDTVVRFNMGIPWGYEKHVGVKIDIWATSFKGRKERQFAAEFWLRQRRCTIWIDYKLREDVPELFAWDKHILTLPEETIASFMVLYNYDEDYKKDTIIEYFRKTAGVHRPSTGLATLYYISTCFEYKSIDLIGFDCFETNVNYWKNLSSKCAEGFHPSHKEKRFLEHMLSENRKINWIKC
jgi:hypothetical protein